MAMEFDQNGRNARALALDVIQQLDDDLFTVRGSTGGNNYTVDMRRKTCTCGDFVYRCKGVGECKHIVAVKLEMALKGTVA